VQACAWTRPKYPKASIQLTKVIQQRPHRTNPPSQGAMGTQIQCFLGLRSLHPKQDVDLFSFFVQPARVTGRQTDTEIADRNSCPIIHVRPTPCQQRSSRTSGSARQHRTVGSQQPFHRWEHQTTTSLPNDCSPVHVHVKTEWQTQTQFR